MNGTVQLRRLASAVQAGDEVPPDVQDWLLGGLAEYERTDDLGAALRLKPSRDARRSRNRHLIEAGRLLGDQPATAKARQIVRTGRLLAAYLDEPNSVARVVGQNNWRWQVWLALLDADIPSYSTVRQLLS